MIVTLKYASALDLVPLVNRLLGAEAGGGAGRAGEAQQRVTLVADPRSNSVMLRSDNPARAARVKALIEQLDTPGRPGGNMFIVYLQERRRGARRADAARAADRRRRAAAPTVGRPRSPRRCRSAAAGATSALATASAAATTPLSTTASSPAAAGGCSGGRLTIQADTANNALIIMGPEPLYNNLRAIIERLDVRRAQVFVEALIVEVAADKRGRVRHPVADPAAAHRQDQRAGLRRHQLRHARQRQQHHRRVAQPGALGQGLNLGIINGTVTIPGPRHDHQPRVPRARAREDAAPTSCPRRRC